MGKWNYRPRRRNYRQQNLWRWSSPPKQFDSQRSPQPLQDNVPTWEKRFCYVIGSIPWWKLVDSKKFISCHSTILEWDDSAVEEAFQNAKKWFWAEMNGFACDISPPDPDLYIDEIDWNPVIDPELMKELDRAYFAPPDDGQGNGKLWRKNKKFRNSFSAPSGGSNTFQVGGVNPWECNNAEIGGISQNKESGWNQWNDHASVLKDVDNNGSSWDCNATQSDRNVKDKAWGDQGKTLCEKSNCDKRNCDNNEDTWGDHGKTSWDKRDLDKRNCDNNKNPWECGYQDSISRKGNCWDSVWDKNDWGWNRQEWNSTANAGDYGGDGPRCVTQWSRYDGQNTDFELRRISCRREEWNGDFQRRENFDYNVSGYKSLRFQGDENRTGDCWR